MITSIIATIKTFIEGILACSTLMKALVAIGIILIKEVSKILIEHLTQYKFGKKNGKSATESVNTEPIITKQDSESGSEDSRSDTN